MMTSRVRQLATVAVAAVITLMASAPARADDTELFVGPAVTAAPSRPNILFIMDTSGSMANTVQSQVPYSATTTFTGSCDAGRIYWSRPNAQGVFTPPACNTNQWVSSSNFTCKAARPNLNSAGIAYVALAAQWKSNNPNRNTWRNLIAGVSDKNIECAADAGLHGVSDSSTYRYAANGSSGPWSDDPDDKISWSTGEPITFYSGNYLNWRASPYVTLTRLQIMQNTLGTLLDNLEDNVNVGLMRYSNDRNTLPNASDGGMVVQAMGRIEDNRAAMKVALNSWVPSGSTPLSETLFEASLYFRGERVFWGLTSDQCFPGQANCPLSSNTDSDTPSVAASRMSSDQTLYDSPADADCQKNYVVYLTDGLPQSDSNSDAAIRALPGFSAVNGYATCTGGPTLASDGDGTGQCLDELAKWMNESDMRPGSDRPGIQNITSYWIGFGSGVAAGSDSLKLVAQRGGGKYYEAADTAELTEAFSEIISRILEQTTTFTSPTVAVNAFNRTQNLNYLYMSVFKPATSYRWLGNIKKYRVTPSGEIRDLNNNAAVDPNTGFFRDGSQSFWSDAADGANAALGGAAGELKTPSTRTIYSNLTTTSGTLTEQLSALKSNLTLANQLLLGVTSSVAVTGRPAVGDLVDWAYGYDVLDENGNNDATEARKDMGDPLHARPSTVIYDGPADDPDITLYATTNDGYFQAINAKTGAELWSFVPREMLGRIEGLYGNDEVSTRNYGLDGAIKVVRLDRNGNGTIEPLGTDINGINGVEENEKDKVLLYFGMRRGGSRYYALDVTVRSSPKLLWSIGPSDLPGIGQTWSAPTVARVNVKSRTWPTENTDKMVLVFGGGYDTVQDTVGYVADSVGNGIYMVDAISGSLIWRAGPTSSGADLVLAKMTNSIPGDVRVVDLTGDGYADRMYAADMGGRVWRFDIRNDQLPSALVWGGVFAQLGAGELADPKPAASNRRFFYAPDVALMKSGTVNFINIALGSGHREKPITDTTVVNRFYSLRDYNMFTQVQNAQYKTTCGTTETSPCHQIVTDSDSRLIDVTSNLNPTIGAGNVGWKMNLTDTSEKVLAESRTFQNRIYFTSYSPEERAYNPEYCVATVGLNRLYVVDAVTAKPVVNFDTTTTGVTSVSDRFKELAQGSIAPEALFVFPTPDAIQGNPNPPAVPPICLVGLESCGTGLNNPPVRTYWQQRGTN